MGGDASLNFDYLKRYSLFGGITQDAFETLRPLIRTEIYETGDIVIAEDSLNDRVYFITSGSVEVLRHLDTGSKGACRRITVMETGDTFGEMELLDVQPCAATIRACEHTETLTLANHDLYRVAKSDLKTYTLLILNLARELSRRIRAMDEMISGERPSSQVHQTD